MSAPNIDALVPEIINLLGLLESYLKADERTLEAEVLATALAGDINEPCHFGAEREDLLITKMTCETVAELQKQLAQVLLVTTTGTETAAAATAHEDVPLF